MNHTSMGQFTYQPLANTRHIRLISLLPSKNSSNRLRCELKEVSLDDDLKYEALSYTWGEPEPKSHLECNGGATLSIQPNLNTVLHYLRHKDSTRVLWVDAVCINQADTTERNHQVALMQDVYFKASKVVAWIGEEDPLDTAAMDVRKHKMLQQPGTSDAVVKTSQKSREEQSTMQVMGALGHLIVNLRATQRLITRPWFSRAWIVQEVAMSKKLQLQCGSKRIWWKDLLGAIKFLQFEQDHEGTWKNISDQHLRRVLFVANTRKQVKQRRRSHHGPDVVSPYDLMRLVSQGRSYSATDPRDHIYAFQGLLHGTNTVTVPIQYSLRFDQVYRNYVRQMIESSKDLSVLGLCDSLHSSGLQSWVPDLRRVSKVSAMEDYDRPVYSTTLDSAAIMGASDDAILALPGIVIDTIGQVAQGPTSEKSKAQSRVQRVGVAVTNKLVNDVLPAIAYKAITAAGPKVKEVVDGILNDMPKPNAEDEAFAQTLSDENRLIHRMGQMFGGIMSEDGERVNDKLLAQRGIGVFKNILKDTSEVHARYLWGQVNVRNEVFMTPKLEDGWRHLLRHVDTYPTGEPVEDAFWRTLTGNRRNRSSTHSDNPPDTWRDAFKIWQSMLWHQQGKLTSLFHDRSNDKHKGTTHSAPFAALWPTKPNTETGYPAIPSHIREYIAQHRNWEPEATASPVPNYHAMNTVLLAVAQTDSETALNSAQLQQKADAMLSDYHNNHDDFADLIDLSNADALKNKKSTSASIQHRVASLFWYDVLHVAKNRMFARTEKGYLGWMPPESQPGDKVVLLLGGRVPFVIRKVGKGKGWRFLGEAYVHGIMNGERMREPEKGDEVQMFELV